MPTRLRRVHAARGLIFTHSLSTSGSTMAARARWGVWSRRMAVTNASMPASSSCSGATLRMPQHRSGSRAHSASPNAAVCSATDSAGRTAADAQAVADLEALPEVVRLVEQQPRIDGEDVNREVLLGNQVNEHTALGAETRAEPHARCELVRGPGEDVSCGLPFQLRRPFACSTLSSYCLAADRLLLACGYKEKGPGALWSIPGLWVRCVCWNVGQRLSVQWHLM